MKALFFLRHYNDIDHITPVVSKWSESGHYGDVVLLGSPKFLNDYRIQYLGSLDRVRVAHIRELLPPWEFFQWRLQSFLLIRGVRRIFLIGKLAKILANLYDARKRNPIWQSTAKRLLQRSFTDTDEGVITFDWVTSASPIPIEWIEIIIAMAKKQRLGAVSLPHGDSPHANQLIRNHERVIKPNTQYADAKIFDKLVVPNELCAIRFRPFLNDAAIAVLGSPRYCDEWLNKLTTLSPPPRLSTNPNVQLRIVIFLRKREFTTFWEEVNIIVSMIAAFPGVELVIKPHTRGGWRQPLTSNTSLRKLPNVSIAEDSVHSISLMNWADVIIDLATSVVFEAVKAKKPVLAADYLHAGRSALAHYMPETELKCRDDIYILINRFLTTGCDNFYIEEHRQRFINEMLHAGGGTDVLSRYVALLEEQAKQPEATSKAASQNKTQSIWERIQTLCGFHATKH